MPTIETAEMAKSLCRDRADQFIEFKNVGIESRHRFRVDGANRDVLDISVLLPPPFAPKLL